MSDTIRLKLGQQGLQQLMWHRAEWQLPANPLVQ